VTVQFNSILNSELPQLIIECDKDKHAALLSKILAQAKITEEKSMSLIL